MSNAIPTLADLAKEYRPSMDREVLHSWAEDVVAALSAGIEKENAELRKAVIEECANVAYSIQPPKSIGRDHGRHHMAGAQAAARAIRARLASTERTEGK